MPNENYVHTVTLYNCLHAVDNPEKKEVWHRHILHHCFYKAVVTTMQNGTQAVQSNTYTVRIPEDDKYVPYARWSMLPDSERMKYFTFSSDDIVIYGECGEGISGMPGQTAAQIMNRHKPDAFKITAVSVNTSMPVAGHYRLGG